MPDFHNFERAVMHAANNYSIDAACNLPDYVIAEAVGIMLKRIADYQRQNRPPVPAVVGPLDAKMKEMK